MIPRLRCRRLDGIGREQSAPCSVDTIRLVKYGCHQDGNSSVPDQHFPNVQGLTDYHVTAVRLGQASSVFISMTAPSSETPVAHFESIIIALMQLLLVKAVRGIRLYSSERSSRRIPDTIQVFETFHKRYDGWFARHKWVYRSEIEALSRLIPKGGLGFEVGVGTGRFATPFRVAVGLDPSGAMASLAKKKGIEVVRGVGENLPFAAETFDFVLLVTTICFVEDPRTTLKEARRVLKDHGSVIVGLVDKNSSLGRSYERRKEASVFYRAARFYSVNQVRDWLAELSFEDLATYQTIFRPLGRIERVEPIREGYGQGGFVALRATKACN